MKRLLMALALFLVPSMAAAQGGYVDRATVTSDPLGLAIDIHGWAYAGEKITPVVTVMVSGEFNGKYQDQVAYTIPTFVRIDVNKHLGIPADTRTGWSAKLPCEFGKVYWVGAYWTDEWMPNSKYVVCRADKPTIEADVVDENGRPAGYGTSDGSYFQVRLIKLGDYYSYQPGSAIQSYSTGQAMVADGKMRIWATDLEPGRYTIIMDGWDVDVAHQTFTYAGEPRHLGTFKMRKHKVSVETVADDILTGEILNYEVRLDNKSGKDVEFYTIVKMPGSMAEIPFEKNRMTWDGRGEMRFPMEGIRVPSWGPNGLYVILEVFVIEKGLQHTVLGRTFKSVYIRR